jgi:hypothetical protein
VRVLDIDKPGDRSTPHEHPDSVMDTLSTFRRRLYSANGESRDVEIRARTQVATGTASCGTQHR